MNTSIDFVRVHDVGTYITITILIEIGGDFNYFNVFVKLTKNYYYSLQQQLYSLHQLPPPPTILIIL